MEYSDAPDCTEEEEDVRLVAQAVQTLINILTSEVQALRLDPLAEVLSHTQRLCQ
jgi:hypothetical protein